MRKAAFAIWNNRIAPVFDVARLLHMVEAESGRIVRETQASLGGELPAQRALRLAEQGIDVLVCGAISRPIQEMVAAFGIQVIPFITGDLNEVVRMWVSDKSNWSAFSMPGCQGHRRGRSPGRRSHLQEENDMAKKIRGTLGGNGMKSAAGRMRGASGRGSAQGSVTLCVCPRCGETRPHQRGIPCFGQTCPKCGGKMIRE